MRLQVFLRGARLNRLRKTPAKSLLSRRQVSIKHRALSSGALSSGAPHGSNFLGRFAADATQSQALQRNWRAKSQPPKKIEAARGHP